MKNKYVFVAVMLLFLMAASIVLTNIYIRYEQDGSGDGHAGHGRESGFHVVTSFYPMYIAAKNVIGDCPGVTLQNLSEPQAGCLHDYQLTTKDMQTLSSADVFIVNGGGIEGFLAEVARQYPQLTVVNASEQVALFKGNAHAWMSVSGYRMQVQAIMDGLSALDAPHAASYQQNGADYLAKLEELQRRQQDIARKCKARNVLIFHEALDYVARDFGFSVCGRMDLDEERQVSAGEVADVLGQIRGQGVQAILAEELYGRQMCEAVQREEDVQVLYLDTCVRGDGEADSYLRAMGENFSLIENIL